MLLLLTHVREKIITIIMSWGPSCSMFNFRFQNLLARTQNYHIPSLRNLDLKHDLDELNEGFGILFEWNNNKKS